LQLFGYPYTQPKDKEKKKKAMYQLSKKSRADNNHVLANTEVAHKQGT
jgi:hypothetical protein